MPYQFRGFGTKGRVVFSPNQTIWQVNQPSITQVVFASSDPNPEVEVSANTNSIIEVTLDENLVGIINIEGESFEIVDNSGTVVFASGHPEEYTFMGVNDFTVVSGAVTDNEYQVIYLGQGSIKYQVRNNKFKYTPAYAAPVAAFTATPVSGFSALEVTFTDQSTGQIDNHTWNFGDGDTSAVQNPVHLYVSAGSYTVSLTVSGPGGSNTLTETDFINVVTTPVGVGDWSLASKQGELYEPNPAGSNAMGWATAISRDGNIAVLGSPFADVNTANGGRITIFERVGTSWQHKQTIDGPSTSERFGDAVAISKDGSRIGVGAAYEDRDGSGNGGVYIYRNDSGTWVLEDRVIHTLIDSNDQFGWDLAFSEDASKLVGIARSADVGSNTDAGRVFLFTRSGTSWSYTRLFNNPFPDNGDRFSSVDMSDDGKTIIVGSALDDTAGTNVGAAYIWKETGGVWNSTPAEILPTSFAGDARFGHSVSTNTDGTIVAVGAIADDSAGNTSGSVYVFTESGGSWSLEQKISSPQIQNFEQFGYSVSMSDNGNVLAVAGKGTGRCYILERSSGVWTNTKTVFDSPGDIDSVALSGDANTILIGDKQDDVGAFNAGRGLVYISG